VTYAIVRHQVLDIRVVVRRAAIYALLTTVAVALIAVIDFFVNKVFEGTKLAALGEIGVAVLLGLALNPLHRRLETAVDAAIFRRRRAGEERLRLIANGLVHANSPQTISRLLVCESSEASELTSVGVFEVNADGNYELTASVGWDDGARRIIDHDASLVLGLIGSGAFAHLTPGDISSLSEYAGRCANAYAGRADRLSRGARWLRALRLALERRTDRWRGDRLTLRARAFSRFGIRSPRRTGDARPARGIRGRRAGHIARSVS